MSALIWFKPKTYGYGATPSNWRGWAATGVFVIVVMALSLVLLGLEPKPGTGASASQDWDLGADGCRSDRRIRLAVACEDRWTMGLALGKVGARTHEKASRPGANPARGVVEQTTRETEWKDA